MHSLSILLGVPEISQRIFELELFGVLVLEKNPGGTHAYPLNVPLLITNHVTPTHKLFHTDGAIGNWGFSMVDDPRIATDEEVVACINDLNDQQWRVILTHELFREIVQEALNTEVNILEAVGAAAGEDEIETNGRRISMGKE